MPAFVHAYFFWNEHPQPLQIQHPRLPQIPSTHAGGTDALPTAPSRKKHSVRQNQTSGTCRAKARVNAKGREPRSAGGTRKQAEVGAEVGWLWLPCPELLSAAPAAPFRLSRNTQPPTALSNKIGYMPRQALLYHRQGFRSSLASSLNDEFDSFSNSPTDPLHAPSWAAEFQQLRIGQPPFQLNIPQGTRASPAPAAASSWHTEFLSTLSQPKSAYTPTLQQQVLQYQQQHQQHPHFLQPYRNFLQQYQQQQPQPVLRTHSPSAYDSPNYLRDTQDTFYPHQHLRDSRTSEHLPPFESKAQQEASNAAFALAFDEAQRWQLESSQHDVLDSISPTTPAPTTDSVSEEKGKGKDQVDPDELSRTAGQLLESLASEQSQKFKESKFMKLMRQLRDKEVKVEGGEMVEVGDVN
ncbi:hypothetical protein BGX38DRAFT_1260609 [Terfezia claveryi]|nr:hypothetical protein BGX38DRAFT_1260609 [Terfezia claveryi]